MGLGGFFGNEDLLVIGEFGTGDIIMIGVYITIISLPII